MRKFVFITGLVVLINIESAIGAAPDSTVSGPYPVSSGEYRFPAIVDPDILPDYKTEIWGKVFYPKDVNQISGKSPLIVMLHGNHGTCGTGSNPRLDYSCEYTYTGECPDGYVPVPNHEGYNYLAENLASYGYWVISINANRGINCGPGAEGDWGLNLARGKLILKHLSLFYQWATQGGAPASIGLSQQPFAGKIDFSSVGLFGHSRGGEGARAAYNLYLDKDSPWPDRIPGLKIKAIFEVGAVDGQTARVLDADGTVWNQLLPMCDGDVADLEGRFPFERMLLKASENPGAQKSLYEVWGANHNFFNTEWQTSETSDCFAGTPIFNPENIGSKEQQTIALASVPAFFRSHLDPNTDAAFNQNFNPLNLLPEVVNQITQVDRDFTPSPGSEEALVFEDFDQETGKNTYGNANLSEQIDIEHQLFFPYHVQRAAGISWQNAGPNTFFESVWAQPNEGRDIRDFATLDFRIARQSNSLNSEDTTDFTLTLEDAFGQFSKPINLSDYVQLNGPGNGNPILQTIRVPLSAFTGVNFSRIHGLRFTFNKTNQGSIYLANIRLHHHEGMGQPAQLSTKLTTHKMAGNSVSSAQITTVPANQNTIRAIRKIEASSALAHHQSGVEIQVASQVPFPVMDSLPILKIGNQEFKLSRYSDPANLKELTFTLTNEQFARLVKGSEITLRNGKIWKFKPLG